jgi:hypothetical protein
MFLLYGVSFSYIFQQNSEDNLSRVAGNHALYLGNHGMYSLTVRHGFPDSH